MKSELRTILRYARNPLHDDPRIADAIAQVGEYSLTSGKRLNSINSAVEFAAEFHLFVEDFDKYVTLVKIIVSYFVMDDHTECEWGDGGINVEKAKAIWSQYNEALDRLSDPNVSMGKWKPYIASFYANMEDALRAYDPDQRQRVVRIFREYADANVKETRAKVEESVKILDRMLEVIVRKKQITRHFDFQIREGTIGAKPVLALYSL